jgi:hypothetical protein
MLNGTLPTFDKTSLIVLNIRGNSLVGVIHDQFPSTIRELDFSGGYPYSLPFTVSPTLSSIHVLCAV